MQWDEYFDRMLDAVAAKSKDSSAKIGCIIVGPDHEIRSTGFNGFPRGVKENKVRNARPNKYAWTEHAERNAIYNAARNGIHLLGCTAYIRWFPCVDCARAIVQSGIARLVCGRADSLTSNTDWNFEMAAEILVEGGVIVDQLLPFVE